MTFTLIALSLAAAAQTVPAEDRTPTAMVEQQGDDPAVMINRATTLARAGREDEARALFEAVRRMKVEYTLETTDGQWIYPADLARQSLRKLDRGEFRVQTIAARN